MMQETFHTWNCTKNRLVYIHTAIQVHMPVSTCELVRDNATKEPVQVRIAGHPLLTTARTVAGGAAYIWWGK